MAKLKEFQKGRRVRVHATTSSVRVSRFAEGTLALPFPMPGEWVYREIPVGTFGTILRSSPDSGPSGKIVKFDGIEHEWEIGWRELELVD